MPEENEVKPVLDEVVRQGAQKMLKAMLQEEVEDFCRKHENKRDELGHRQIVRNGYHKARQLVTGSGQLDIQPPRVDDRALRKTEEPRFQSSLIPPYLKRTQNIEEFVPYLYLKGISTGDFTDVMEKLTRKRVAGFSPENIVRMKQIWERDYKTWIDRDLSKKKYVYWWVDGIHFNVRLDNDRQCILVVIGATEDGTKELIAVEDGFRESKESWQSLIRDLKRRGLKDGPKLAIGDGALGFWAALPEEFPDTKPQGCWVHKTANVLDKLPTSLQGKGKKMIHDIYLSPTKDEANKAFDEFIKEFELKYPKAVRSLTDNRDRLLNFYDVIENK